MNTSPKDPLDLAVIKEALIMRALDYGFLTPLMSFVTLMELRWGETKTAHATIEGGKRIIELGRLFFSEQVLETAHAVDISLHEIMHHILMHLPLVQILAAQGYSRAIQGLAKDAIINAYLHKIGSASFMEHYYPDADEYAFLRPNSTAFKISSGNIVSAANEQTPVNKVAIFRTFYSKLYKLEVTLEQTLEFFNEHFPQPELTLILLGSHPEIDESIVIEGKGSASGGQNAIASGSIFTLATAKNFLDDIDPESPSAKLRSQFQRIIRQVTSAVNSPGQIRKGFRLSQQPPSRVSLRETIKLERGQDWYSRGKYRRREVWLFLDVSGSVKTYLPFAAGLVASLEQSRLRVRIICWADDLHEVSLADISLGRLPKDVGAGTNGEKLVRFIVSEKIAQAIIITDNVAGIITTSSKAEIHVCLIADGRDTGSFLNRERLPNSHCYRLHP